MVRLSITFVDEGVTATAELLRKKHPKRLRQ